MDKKSLKEQYWRDSGSAAMQGLNVPKSPSEGERSQFAHVTPSESKARKKLPLGQGHLSCLQQGHQADSPPRCLAAAQRRVSEPGKGWNPREVSGLRVRPVHQHFTDLRSGCNRGM